MVAREEEEEREDLCPALSPVRGCRRPGQRCERGMEGGRTNGNILGEGRERRKGEKRKGAVIILSSFAYRNLDRNMFVYTAVTR
jgi:hypothetical protein